MKLQHFVLCAVMLLFVVMTYSYGQDVADQDSTGLPGDNFSLQGALEMFKTANSPEEFEKLLNTEENHVNNLDLNSDGDIDYIRVVGAKDKDAHAFTLQVPISEKENQDIAVIELEKNGDASAVVQILGDEDIFGEQTIVEPGDGDDDAEEDAGGGRPHYAGYSARIVVNVWGWPCVRFVYAPAYAVWVSPWRWRSYPVWWRPWRPIAWRVFHPFRARYHRGFAVVRTHRVLHAHRVYAPLRATSVTVRTRHGASVKHYRTTRTTTIKTKAGTTRVKTTKKATRVGKKR